MCFHTDNEVSDRTARMLRLILVFVGLTFSDLVAQLNSCMPRVQ